jgi:hypothetical protein
MIIRVGISLRLRPSELPSPKRELNEGKVINVVVEEGSFGEREVVVVLFGGVFGQFEIAGDNPRGGITRVMRGEIKEEVGLIRMVAGSVNVSNTESRAVNLKREV